MGRTYTGVTEDRIKLILASLRTSLSKETIGYECREILEAREVYWEERYVRLTDQKIYHVIVNKHGTPMGVGNSKRRAIFMAYCVCTSVGQQETMSSMDWWDRVNVQGYKYKKTMAAA